MKQAPLKRKTPLARSGLKATSGGKGCASGGGTQVSLKRGKGFKPTAGYDYQAFIEGIADRDGADCFVRRYVPMDRALLACDGKLDGHHLLPKQWLKREYPDGAALLRDGAPEVDATIVTLVSLADLLNDPRGGVLCCRKHHDLLENARIALSAEVLPGCVFEFAAELGERALARLERDYGMSEAA